MSLGVRLSCLSRCVSVCVCRITLGGEGNALYPVLSTVFLLYAFVLVVFTLKAQTIRASLILLKKFVFHQLQYLQSLTVFTVLLQLNNAGFPAAFMQRSYRSLGNCQTMNSMNCRFSQCYSADILNAIKLFTCQQKLNVIVKVSQEDEILIKKYLSQRYNLQRLLSEFPSKGQKCNSFIVSRKL